MVVGSYTRHIQHKKKIYSKVLKVKIRAKNIKKIKSIFPFISISSANLQNRSIKIALTILNKISINNLKIKTSKRLYLKKEIRIKSGIPHNKHPPHLDFEGELPLQPAKAHEHPSKRFVAVDPKVANNPAEVGIVAEPDPAQQPHLA